MRRQSLRSLQKKKSEERKSALALLPKYQEYFESAGLWSIAEDIIEAVNTSIIEPYNTRANVQKADAQIPELKIEDFKPFQPKPQKPNTPQQPNGNEPSDTPNVPEETPKSPSPGDDPRVPAESPVPNEMDDYKSLSSVERALVRKFLSVINSMTDLPDKQKTKLKTRLRKKIIK